MSTYRVEDWNEKMQPQRYRTSDGKYFDVKNPSTLINKNSGREVKYGNFIRMYKEEGNNSNILKMAVPNNKSNRNNSNILKMRAPLNSNWNTNTMNLSRVNSSHFSYNTPKAPKTPSYNPNNFKMRAPNRNQNNKRNQNKTRANRKNRRSTRKN